jgi:hypothetical protein
VFCELQCLGLLYRKYRNKILLSYCNIWTIYKQL